MSEPFNPFAAPETGGYSQSSLQVGDFERLAGVERGLRMVYLGICGIIISAIIAGLSAILFPPLAVVAGLGVVICWLLASCWCIAFGGPTAPRGGALLLPRG